MPALDNEESENLSDQETYIDNSSQINKVLNSTSIYSGSSSSEHYKQDEMVISPAAPSTREVDEISTSALVASEPSFDLIQNSNSLNDKNDVYDNANDNVNNNGEENTNDNTNDDTNVNDNYNEDDDGSEVGGNENANNNESSNVNDSVNDNDNIANDGVPNDNITNNDVANDDENDANNANIANDFNDTGEEQQRDVDSEAKETTTV